MGTLETLSRDAHNTEQNLCPSLITADVRHKNNMMCKMSKYSALLADVKAPVECSDQIESRWKQQSNMLTGVQLGFVS